MLQWLQGIGMALEDGRIFVYAVELQGTPGSKGHNGSSTELRQGAVAFSCIRPYH